MRRAAVKVKGNSRGKTVPQLLWQVKQELCRVWVVGKEEGRSKDPGPHHEGPWQLRASPLHLGYEQLQDRHWPLCPAHRLGVWCRMHRRAPVLLNQPFLEALLTLCRPEARER